MDRVTRPRRALRWLVLPIPFAATGCPGAPKDPPPAAESLEITSAAPRALGALAGGTDAAPPVGIIRRTPTPDDPFGLEQPPHDFEEQEPDAGAEDAGPQSEAPENVPL
jgi:hypothetical protein